MEHTLCDTSSVITPNLIKDQLLALFAFVELPEMANQPYVSGGTWYVNKLVAIPSSETIAKFDDVQIPP